ncbi:MAG: flippase-like domain-containing protein, partial [Deltaproteobacteria bacterium]|nr:flippase-like domain-containing protein [Deltaproteobacteria bacterium]
FSQRLLLPVTCIGFLFVWILPARLGELARPYLLSQNSKVDLSPAMGSVVLERLIDSVFLVVLLAICLPALQLPSLILSSFKGFVFILLTAVLLVLLGSLPGFRERFFQVASRILPASLSDFLTRIAETFYSGMQAVTSLKSLLVILALTSVIWAASLVSLLILFRSMDLPLGLLAGITVLVLTCIGIALPAAPGFIGNYHYACVVALGLFGVGKDIALAYAILLHFLTLAVLVILGVFFINVSKIKVGFSLRSATSSWKQATGSEKD